MSEDILAPYKLDFTKRQMRLILAVCLHYHPIWADVGRELEKSVLRGDKLARSGMLTDAFAYWYNERRFELDSYSEVFDSIFESEGK